MEGSFGELKFGKLLYGVCPMQLSQSGVAWPVLYFTYIYIATISGSLIVSVK